jgi:hypothetical protein
MGATSVAQAVWSYTPRSLTDIQSLTAAIQNNNPGAVPSYADLTYVPVPYYAGQVSLTQAAAFIDNAVRNYGLAGAFANYIANNPYNLWTSSFVSAIAVNPYITATALNMLILQSAMSGNSAQLILYQLAQNYYYNKWVYTVTASAPSSITFSTNETLSTNVLIAQNITIASGVTVTCGTQTCFFIAQSFNNQGTIVSPYGAIGGSSPGTDIGVGGTGGGGVVIIAYTAVPGTINLAGSPGGVGNSGATVGLMGGNGGAGVFYVVTGVAVPVGGSGAGASGYAGGAGANGGGGGVGSSGYAGGGGGGATVHSFSGPNAMVTYILQGLSDWWLINVVGKAPSSTTPLAYMYGSGGGAGGGVYPAGPGGAGGGGGGGEAVVYGFNIVSGNITAVGGTGGYSPSNGGGGGGGGLVFIFYGATSGNVTASVSGGIGGDVGGTGLPGASGTAYIAAVTVNG